MKKIKFYLGSMWRSYRTKPLIILLMVFVICMASVFASYMFKFIDSLKIDTVLYNVSFSENSTGYQDVISEMEKEFGKPMSMHFDAAIETIISKDEANSLFAQESIWMPRPKIYLITDKEKIKDELWDVGKYFVEEDFESGRNIIVIGENTLTTIKCLDRYKNISVGDIVKFNGYDYEFRGIEEDGYGGYAIINESIPIQMKNIGFVYDKSINMSRFVKLCKRMNLTETESGNYYGILYGKIFSLIGLFLIFSINIIILYNHFMREDRKLYAEYKMLGAKNYEICLAMFFATIPIVLIGSLLGLGIEALVAGSVWIDGRHMYLSALEYFMIGIINVGISLIALLFAAIRRAVKRPVDI